MTVLEESHRTHVSILIVLLLCLLATRFIQFKAKPENVKGNFRTYWQLTGSVAASAVEELYFNEMRPLELKIEALCFKNRRKSNNKRYDKLCTNMIKRLLAWKKEITQIVTSSTVTDVSRDGRRRKPRSADGLAKSEDFDAPADVGEISAPPPPPPSEATSPTVRQQSQASVEERNRKLMNSILSRIDLDPILRQILANRPSGAESRCDYDLIRSATMKDFLLLCSEEFARYNISARIVDDNQLVVCGLSDDSGKNFTATKYSPHQWTNQLEKDLTQDSNNYPKSRALAKAYQTHIHPVTGITRYKSLDHNFRWFMHRYNVFFGNKDYSVLRPMSLYSEFDPFQKVPSLKKALENFEREVSMSYPEVPKYNGTAGKLKVVIVTGPYGAGHTSTAAALSNAFQESPDFDVVKVDECTDFPDTLFIATCGKYHSCKIYNDVIVRDNDLEKAEFLSMLNLMLTDYIPQNKFGKLNERLRQERPDLIISTVHHIPEITENSFLLNRPLRIMVTDYEFPQKQWHPLNHVPATLVRYWVPSTNRNLFRPMVKDYLPKSWEARNKESRTQTINETLFVQNLPMESTFRKLGALELLPFPVASAINPPKDWNDVVASRRKLVLTESPDRKVIAVAQGGTPNTKMMAERIAQLINDSDALVGKFQIAVVTSGIQPLIDKVTEMFRSNNISIMTEQNKIELENSDEKVIARVFQRLRYPVDMGELYKASDLLISKSGGATSAEVIASATKFVNGFPLWEWEIENTKHLESLGLAPDIAERASAGRVNVTSNLKVYTLPVESPVMVMRINAMLTKPRLYEAPARCFRNEDARRAAVEAVRTSEETRRDFAEGAKKIESERNRMHLTDVKDPGELLRKLTTSFMSVHNKLLSLVR